MQQVLGACLAPLEAEQTEFENARRAFYLITTFIAKIREDVHGMKGNTV